MWHMDVPMLDIPEVAKDKLNIVITLNLDLGAKDIDRLAQHLMHPLALLALPR